ncbi:MAG: tryptophan 7-halogenase [Phycisphaeraceae bacterium]|nr:tryptophan 7-halogenase [Phycisphaerales bacterium]MCB9859316.1 tryptophan 7-halogenase [Phycisphaeraceae bacterium]
MECDVAIIGGGPSGSTVSTLLKKYNPALRVVVIEREVFPRDHIGESQLPAISGVLNEMGVWDKVEAANFPIKIGASLTWGRDQESWDFDFYDVESFVDEPRPAKFEGQRRSTAFQVDRAIYDDILLNHAKSCGADVLQPARVAKVHVENEGTPIARIESLELESGEQVTARWYVDASGNVGLMRRALGVKVDAPKVLENIAFWDYWENTEWAVKIGVGATRIQIRSLPWGWMWFIPIGPTRTSIGLVCPAAYYKQSGKSPAELYNETARAHPQIEPLIRNATQRGNVESTRDWSYLAKQVAGENWFLVGEAAGFADPVLSAGMTLAHTSSREAAYTLLEIERAEIDADWLRNWYNDKTRANINQHIRFAEYWYASNGCFTDLREHCREIARSAGLRLSPAEAWRWLAQGGFSNQDIRGYKLGSFDIGAARKLVGMFSGEDEKLAVAHQSTLNLNLSGAKDDFGALLQNGRIERIPCWRKGQYILPKTGLHANLVNLLNQTSDSMQMLNLLYSSISSQFPPHQRDRVMLDHVYALESMISTGWVQAKKVPNGRTIDFKSFSLRSSDEGLEALHRRDEREAGKTGNAQ